MKSLKSAALSLAILSFSSLVHAQGIEAVTMTSDPDDVVFTLRSDKNLMEPSIKTYDGQIRVRFPESSAPNSIQVAGDGAAIKGVDVRSGSHDSAVMRIDLGDTSKLSADDVRVEMRNKTALVRIARDLLPPLREPRVAAPAEAKKVEAPAQAAPQVAPQAPVQAAPAQKPAALQKPKPLTTAMQSESSSSPMPMLLGVSAILALAYAAMRILLKKQNKEKTSIAPIDIVAQKRIGPRHQLVIVRAFGREHLLSIQGGTTTPIATNDAEFDALAAEEPAPVVERREREHTKSHRIPSAQKPAEPTQKEETAFGSELIRVALAQRLKDQTAKVANTQTEAEEPRSKDDKALSQAVAGLVKLRREARMD